MGRIALTLWFTITSLVGPGVCCCSFAAAKPAADSPTQAEPNHAVQPAKPCCQHEASPCDSRSNSNPDPVKPCPCSHDKQVYSLPSDGDAIAGLSAQLKLFDALFVGFLAPVAFDHSTPASANSNTSQPVLRLAGRDLLSAYSLLRC